MRDRLRQLWFAYYRTSRIAEILEISQAAVVVEVSKLWLGYRDPHDFATKYKPDRALENWDPLKVSTPLGGRPSVLWPPGKSDELLELRGRGMSDKAIAELWGSPYTKAVVLAKRWRIESGEAQRSLVKLYPVSVFLVPWYFRPRVRKPVLPERPVMRLPYAELGQPLIVRNKILRVPPKEDVSGKLSFAAQRQVNQPTQRQDQLFPSRSKPPWDDVVSTPKPKVIIPPRPKPQRRPKGFYATKKVTKMFDEGDEQAKIDEFLRVKGVTRCPPVFSAPTQTTLTSSEEQERLKTVKTPEKLTREEALAERKRISSKQRQWHEARQAAAMRAAGQERS